MECNTLVSKTIIALQNIMYTLFNTQKIHSHVLSQYKIQVRIGVRLNDTASKREPMFHNTTFDWPTTKHKLAKMSLNRQNLIAYIKNIHIYKVSINNNIIITMFKAKIKHEYKPSEYTDRLHLSQYNINNIFHFLQYNFLNISQFEYTAHSLMAICSKVN